MLQSRLQKLFKLLVDLLKVLYLFAFRVPLRSFLFDNSQLSLPPCVFLCRSQQFLLKFFGCACFFCQKFSFAFLLLILSNHVEDVYIIRRVGHLSIVKFDFFTGGAILQCISIDTDKLYIRVLHDLPVNAIFLTIVEEQRQHDCQASILRINL